MSDVSVADMKSTEYSFFFSILGHCGKAIRKIRSNLEQLVSWLV